MNTRKQIDKDQSYLIYSQQQNQQQPQPQPQSHQGKIIKQQTAASPPQLSQYPALEESCRKLRKRFTKEEDDHMLSVIASLGKKSIDWRVVEAEMPKRSARQCRERYCNYLCKEKKKGNWTREEDRLIIKLFNELGPRWVEIASSLERRTNIDCKNRHFTLINKISKHGLTSLYDVETSSSGKHTDNDDYSEKVARRRNSPRKNSKNNNAETFSPIPSSDLSGMSNGEEETNNFPVPVYSTPTTTDNNSNNDTNSNDNTDSSSNHMNININNNNGRNGRVCVFPSLLDLLNDAPIRPILDEGKLDPFSFINPISLMNRV